MLEQVELHFFFLSSFIVLRRLLSFVILVPFLLPIV